MVKTLFLLLNYSFIDRGIFNAAYILRISVYNWLKPAQKGFTRLVISAVSEHQEMFPFLASCILLFSSPQSKIAFSHLLQITFPKPCFIGGKSDWNFFFLLLFFVFWLFFGFFFVAAEAPTVRQWATHDFLSPSFSIWLRNKLMATYIPSILLSHSETRLSANQRGHKQGGIQSICKSHLKINELLLHLISVWLLGVLCVSFMKRLALQEKIHPAWHMTQRSTVIFVQRQTKEDVRVEKDRELFA